MSYIGCLLEDSDVGAGSRLTPNAYFNYYCMEQCWQIILNMDIGLYSPIPNCGGRLQNLDLLGSVLDFLG